MTLADMKGVFSKLLTKDPKAANEFALYVTTEMFAQASLSEAPASAPAPSVNTSDANRDNVKYRWNRSRDLYNELSRCNIDDERVMADILASCDNLGKAAFQTDAVRHVKKVVAHIVNYMSFGGNVFMDPSVDFPLALVRVMEIGAGSCCNFGNEADHAKAVQSVKDYVYNAWQ